MKVSKDILNFEYQTGEKTDGLFADIEADGTLTHIGHYKNGQLVDGMFLKPDGNKTFREEYGMQEEDVIARLKDIADLRMFCKFCGNNGQEVSLMAAFSHSGIICHDCIKTCQDILSGK